MPRCGACSRLMLWSRWKSDGEWFCSSECFYSNPNLKFCAECLSSTTSESPGNSFSVNGIPFFALGPGRRKWRCPTCHSALQTYLVFFFPADRYRVLYVPGTKRYVARKVRA